ncbi:phosducin-like protein [Artemisia annua]|uniref:Phosducin-like protein n=1 Tax=Artemisia annua TaxID=35608 RepID=A0A2U1MZW6_ARTAN|nr:phosducin-like protein [Artemisia annua]
MNPDTVKSTLQTLAYGNVMAAAARDYQKELLAQEKAQTSSSFNEEVDLDELMDDPELEKLHADRIAALKREAEKRQSLTKKGHGEYREVSEGDFLGEVTGSEKVICHFYHREFYRCKGERDKKRKMNPDTVKSTLQTLAYGNVMAAAARDYQKELLAQEKAQTSSSFNEEVDLDELMDDPELEKLHADRIAALKREAEKRQSLTKKGHGEYREVSEGDFLGEVTGSEKVICHFYHREFYRCKIMDKHLKTLAPSHLNTKFIKVDAENSPFFVTKLGIKMLPCVILFRQGIAGDRLVGFQDLGGKDDFSTRKLEVYLIKKVRYSANNDSDSE